MEDGFDDLARASAEKTRKAAKGEKGEKRKKKTKKLKTPKASSKAGSPSTTPELINQALHIVGEASGEDSNTKKAIKKKKVSPLSFKPSRKALVIIGSKKVMAPSCVPKIHVASKPPPLNSLLLG